MKNFLVMFCLSIALCTFVGAAFAQSPTGNTASGGNQTQRITNLKTRGDAEIDRRIKALNDTVTRIANAKRLPASDKATFTSQVQTEITNLTNLRAKIDADTDLTTLKTDVGSIVTSYRVFALFIPKMRIMVAADAMGEGADLLSALATKLGTRITQAGSPANLQTLLTDMQAKIADAKTQYSGAESEVSPLDPSGYPGNKSTLLDARSKIKTGAADLKAALLDARQIRDGLKGLKTTLTPISKQ